MKQAPFVALAGVLLALPAGSAFSSLSKAPIRPAVSTIYHESCLAPGKNCNLEKVAEELKFVRAMVFNLENDLGEVDAQMKRQRGGPPSPALASRRSGINSKILGWKKVECRLKNMRDSLRNGSTIFNGSGVAR